MKYRVQYFLIGLLLHASSLVLVVFISLYIFDDFSGSSEFILVPLVAVHFMVFNLLGKVIIVLATWRGGWQDLPPKLVVLMQCFPALFVVILGLSSGDLVEGAKFIMCYLCVTTPVILFYSLFRSWVLKKENQNQYNV